MPNSKYQVSEPSGSEAEDFFHIMYFYDSNIGSLWLGHFGTLDVGLNKLGKK